MEKTLELADARIKLVSELGLTKDNSLIDMAAVTVLSDINNMILSDEVENDNVSLANAILNISRLISASTVASSSIYRLDYDPNIYVVTGRGEAINLIQGGSTFLLVTNN